MAGGTGEERKLPPTHKKRQDARRQGNVPTSRDLATALGVLAATGAIAWGGVALLDRLKSALVDGFARMGDRPTRDLSTEDLTPLVVSSGVLIAMCVGPIALAAAGTSAASTLMQTRFLFSTERLKVNWGKLNPASGMKRLSPANAGLDTLKTLVIGVVLSIIGWRLGKAMTAETARLVWTQPMAAFSYAWGELLRLMWQSGLVFLLVGAADMFLQRWRHTRSLRMTKHEVKQEHKEQEQKPEVKSAIRKAQMAIRRRNMMKAVKNATVVLTNPTHFAVALEYKREKNSAPVVVAKGADLIAFKIREIARQHSVPVIENPALTRALYKECDLGDAIPGPLFGAVAEVLAYLIRIKQLVL